MPPTTPEPITPTPPPYSPLTSPLVSSSPLLSSSPPLLPPSPTTTSPPHSPPKTPTPPATARTTHLNALISAMKTVDATTIDKAGRAAKELLDSTTFAPRDFIYVAVRLLMNLETRFLDGENVDIFAGGVDPQVRRRFDERFRQLVVYLKRCKNSCKILMKPTFLDDVLNNPEEMLRRFVTNHKGYGTTSKRKLKAMADAQKSPTPNKKGRVEGGLAGDEGLVEDEGAYGEAGVDDIEGSSGRSS